MEDEPDTPLDLVSSWQVEAPWQEDVGETNLDAAWLYLSCV